jgi:hypothetical protein
MLVPVFAKLASESVPNVGHTLLVDSDRLPSKLHDVDVLDVRLLKIVRRQCLKVVRRWACTTLQREGDASLQP